MMFFIGGFVYPQEQKDLTLEYCLESLMQKHPLAKQGELSQNAWQLKDENLRMRYLPQASLSGNASWQSDVTYLDIDFSQIQVEIPGAPIPAGGVSVKGPEIPKPARDNYRLNLEISQMVFDGNLTRYQRQIELLEQKNEVFTTESELRNLREALVNIYLQALLLSSVREQLQLAEEELIRQKEKAKAGIKHGLLPESSLFILEAEHIRLQQQIHETDWNRVICYDRISKICGIKADTTMTMILPGISQKQNVGFHNRTEIQLLENRQTQLLALKNINRSGHLPKIFAFGQAGYGKPGLNMFSDEFNTFYIVGAKLSWNLWDWNQQGRERKILDFKSQIIENQKQGLIISLENANAQYISDESRLMKTIENDRMVVELRRKITQSAASQFENGVITATQYMAELNSEIQAKLLLDQHIIQLVKSQLSQQLIHGNL
jgi:outer membrane protein TolC